MTTAVPGKAIFGKAVFGNGGGDGPAGVDTQFAEIVLQALYPQADAEPCVGATAAVVMAQAALTSAMTGEAVRLAHC